MQGGEPPRGWDGRFLTERPVRGAARGGEGGGRGEGGGGQAAGESHFLAGGHEGRSAVCTSFPQLFPGGDVGTGARAHGLLLATLPVPREGPGAQRGRLNSARRALGPAGPRAKSQSMTLPPPGSAGTDLQARVTAGRSVGTGPVARREPLHAGYAAGSEGCGRGAHRTRSVTDRSWKHQKGAGRVRRGTRVRTAAAPTPGRLREHRRGGLLQTRSVTKASCDRSRAVRRRLEKRTHTCTADGRTVCKNTHRRHAPELRR